MHANFSISMYKDVRNRFRFEPMSSVQGEEQQLFQAADRQAEGQSDSKWCSLTSVPAVLLWKEVVLLTVEVC